MGVHKISRRILAMRGMTAYGDIIQSTGGSSDAGIREPVQTISLSGASSTGTTAVTNRGFTFITSTGTGAGWFLPLAAPGVAGRRKTIQHALGGNSTVPVQIRTASSAQPFFGTTKNAFTFTTELSTETKTVELVSKSSVQWSITSIYPTATTATTWITVQAATA